MLFAMNNFEQEPLDLPARSWYKALTWRLIGIVILGGITYAFTRDWGKTTWITIIFHGLRTVLYYFHERWWERISWGRRRHPLSHLKVREDLSPADHEAIRHLLHERKYLDKPDYEI